MIYFWIIVFLILSIYIYFFYKDKWFILMSKNWLASIFLVFSLIFSLVSFFSYNINFNQKIKTKTSDIVFVLDVSKSMLALDYGEKSRLQLSKEIIRDYVVNNPNNRYSLTIFSWDVTSLIPLTDDKNIFLTFLNSVDEKSILKWWTNFEEALKISTERFQKNAWAIVILSDFEPNVSTNEKQKIIDQLKYIKNDNLKFFWIWLWSEKWNKIFVWYDIFGWVIYLKDRFWKDIITKFDKDFFNWLLNKLDAWKFIITKQDDTKKIEFLGIPSNNEEVDVTMKKDFSRYLMILSFLSFLSYLILFYYFDKKWK